jgi:hypothetical protein
MFYMTDSFLAKKYGVDKDLVVYLRKTLKGGRRTAAKVLRTGSA